MSGHNKFSKIKHKKAATDAKKSKIFSKLNKLITAEAKKAGGNVDSPGLRAVIEKAKKENMPKDTIERAIKKATESGGADMENVTYEAYGPSGVGIVIEGLTDNRNKAAAEVRHVLSQNGIELAANGSASWAFKKEGTDWIPETTIPVSLDDMSKIENLVEALEDNDEVQEVFHNAVVE